MVLRVEMLPAERGDALLLEYGAGSKVTNRVLVDGGPVNSGNYEAVRARLAMIDPHPDGRRHFDLLVITHVDADHIEGAIRLLQDDDLRCVFDDIWYNGWRQLKGIEAGAAVEVLGPNQGEFFGALLYRQGRPWNQYFRGDPVVITSEGDLPKIVLRGGLSITLLSPTRTGLERLAAAWNEAVQKAGFEPGNLETAYTQFEGAWWAQPPGPTRLGATDRVKASNDNTEANGSSIALLAEYCGRSVLLAADAHDDVLTASLRRLRNERDLTQRLTIDALKLSHHGSKHNTTPQLLDELECHHYLVSSSGHRFSHPDAITIKRVIDHHTGHGLPVIHFNYDQAQTDIWKNNDGLEARFDSPSAVELPSR